MQAPTCFRLPLHPAMIEQKHSRLPVYEGTPEKIVGLLHYKDLLPVWEERRRAIRSSRPSHAFRIGRLMRPVLFVPETKPASQMFDEFRTGRSHLAMVVDEFGTIIGMSDHCNSPYTTAATGYILTPILGPLPS